MRCANRLAATRLAAKRRAMVALRGALGLLIAFSLMALGGWIFVSYSLPNLDLVQRALTWPEVPCRITRSGVKTVGSSKDVTHHADLVYTYVLGKRTYTSDVIDFLYAPTGSQSEAQQLADQYPVNSDRVCYVDPENPFRSTLRRGHRAEHAAAFMPLIIVLLGVGVFGVTVWWLVKTHRASVAPGAAP